MPADTILVIALGKYKWVACTYDRATTAAEFRTFTTSRAEVERLVRTACPAVVVIEAWKYKHARRKTDRDDALRLAQLEALGQLPEVVVPAKWVASGGR